MSSKYISAELREFVAIRANFVCEYCLISKNDTYFGCEVEHIISRKHGGTSDPENLAYACLSCNRFKGSDLGSLSKETTELLRFYNPRTDHWKAHFRLDGVVIEPLTPIGEVTTRILRMNSNERLLERRGLERSGSYPSKPALLLISDQEKTKPDQ